MPNIDTANICNSDKLKLLFVELLKKVPNCQNNFDKYFMEHVQQKLSEYPRESSTCKDDVLEKSLTIYEVSRVCLSLPNGKAGGLDGLVYEHLKCAGNYIPNVLTSVITSLM